MQQPIKDYEKKRRKKRREGQERREGGGGGGKQKEDLERSRQYKIQKKRIAHGVCKISKWPPSVTFFPQICIESFLRVGRRSQEIRMLLPWPLPKGVVVHGAVDHRPTDTLAFFYCPSPLLVCSSLSFSTEKGVSKSREANLLREGCSSSLAVDGPAGYGSRAGITSSQAHPPRTTTSHPCFSRTTTGSQARTTSKPCPRAASLYISSCWRLESRKA